MPRIIQIVKKMAAAGFSTMNTVVSLKPAPALSPAVAGTVTVGLGTAEGVGPAPITALTTVVLGEGAVPAVSGAVRADLAPAAGVGSRMSLAPVPVSDGTQEITYVNLAGTYGASTATNTTNSGNAWTNTGNATGVHNGTTSGHNGALSAQDASLAFTFPTFPNKAGLTVTAAKLRFYVSQGGTLLNNALLELARGTASNPAATFIASFTNNVDFMTTPYEVDLFAAGFTAFASLENFGARVRGSINAGALGVTQAVDAVELVVTATA